MIFKKSITLQKNNHKKPEISICFSELESFYNHKFCTIRITNNLRDKFPIDEISIFILQTLIKN